MSRLAWVVVLVLFAIVPAVGFEEPIGRQRQLAQPGFPQFPDSNYTAPKSDGPVAVLLDEGIEPIFPVLNNDHSGQNGQIKREERDVFAGVEAARITDIQMFRSRIPGWDFKIVETPKAAGEFRYLRFAWKKSGGSGIMVQFFAPDNTHWNHRFFAGRNSVNWQPSVSVSDKLPVDWELVTRDLFKEFGAHTITGLALTAMDGPYALFDHMLLGRTIEDLDKATDAALGKVKPEKPLAGMERDALGADLLGTDRVKAATAIRAFLATAPDQVGFVRDHLAGKGADKEAADRIRKLVADLDADEFDVRDAATEALIKIGAPAVESVRSLATNGPNVEVKFRAKLILKKLGADGTPVSTAGKMARVARVLERAGTKDARDLLTRMADGEFGADGAPDAKLALSRLQKK